MRKALDRDQIGVRVGAAAAMVVSESGGRPLKRQRRRVTAELRDFRFFPSKAEEDVFHGPFRANVKEFLSSFAWIPPPSSAAVLPHLVTWRMPLTVGGEGGGGVVEGEGKDAAAAVAVVDLEVVVEEDVARAKAVHCDQCRVVGWSGNPVCAKRYHFIIRNDGKAMARPHQKCVRCESSPDVSDMRCTTCNFAMSEDDIEDWDYQLLEDNTHLLHGVVHSNGYGHLLRVNGREGGSKFLRGRDIMDFWDRLCRMLRVRKVTVMDISKKYGLEYRLLHAITTGRPWYGEWGYEFGTGSFAITAKAYEDAINTLSRLPLSLFFSHPRSPRSQLQNVIAFYWSLADCQLLTVGEIFHFMLQLIHESCELVRSDSVTKKHLQASTGILCAWTMEEVKLAEQAIVKVLQAVANGNWVPFRALRGAACQTIGSIELLDYCLKGLSGKLAGDGMVVVAQCNADTNSIEYRLEPVADIPSNSRVGGKPSEDHLLLDLKFLYDALLNPHTMHSYKPQDTRVLAFRSATILLDCKRFIKNYDSSLPAGMSSNTLHIWCELELSDQPRDYTGPPRELLVLSETATIAHLKLAATRAFQEVYIAYQRFEVVKLVDYDGFSNSTNVKLLLGKIGSIKVKGRCPSDNRLAQFRMERGTEKWIVECLCGAEDDDGERMVACDVCNVWSHTRCIGVSDFDEVPKKFVCLRCSGRQSSGAKAFNATFRASNRRSKRITNNEIVTRSHVNRRDVQSRSVSKDAIVAGGDKPFINKCSKTVEDMVISAPDASYEFAPSTAGIPNNRHDVMVLADITNRVKTNESYKHELNVADVVSGRIGNGGGAGTIDDIAPFSKFENETIPTTDILMGNVDNDDERLTGEVAELMDDICMGNEGCTDEAADIKKKDFTDRGSGRCKDDMASPIAEVGMYVTMTCK